MKERGRCNNWVADLVAAVVVVLVALPEGVAALRTTMWLRESTRKLTVVDVFGFSNDAGVFNLDTEHFGVCLLLLSFFHQQCD